MSSHTKDPLEKQDTPSESSDSHSESDVEKAEENLEHLKIEERLTKEGSDESKPLVSPQEGPLTNKCDLSNEPIAGPSGLQEPRLESSDPESKVVGSCDPQKGEDMETKEIDDNIGAKMVEGDSDTTSSTPPFIQSSTGVTPSSMLQDVSSVSEQSGIKNKEADEHVPLQVIINRFMSRQTLSSSSKRFDYATDSANTSSDVSEIRSEMVDNSAEGSVYHDAPESFEKDQSPSYASAVERQSSETSGTSISELQDDFVPPPTLASSSTSSSTPSGEQGHRAYLAQLQREAEARGVPISTSSGIGSTNMSELAHLQAWNEAGEMGFYRHDADDPNQDVSNLGACGMAPQPTSESMDDHQMQDLDRMFEQEQQNEGNEKPILPKAVSGCVSRRRQKGDDGIPGPSEGAGSPSKRRRSLKGLSDSSKEEKLATEKPRPRLRPDTVKKGKMVTSKSSPALLSSSESPEPKSSSSDELHRKDSPEIKSSSEGQESSKSDRGRKPWQNRGLLRSMQLSNMSSIDSVIAEEEEDRTSTSREQESMETQDSTTEKTKTLGKASEGATKNTEPSESKPSVELCDQACGLGAEEMVKEHEQGLEFSNFERSVGKSKRGPKLSSSPPSDEALSSSPPKAATSRPSKKAKSEIGPRRTRHDSGGTVPQNVSLGDLQQSESTSTPDTSDYTPSDDEKETAL